MSGVNRNINAELNSGKAVSFEDYKKAFSPEEIIKEEGTPDMNEKSEQK